MARLAFDLGIFKVNISSTGGVRVGTKVGATNISHRVVAPATKPKVGKAVGKTTAKAGPKKSK